MRALTLVLTSLLLASCEGSSPGSTAAQGSPPPPAATPSASPGGGQPIAALVDFANGTGPQSTGYDLALVGADGHVAAHTHAAARSFIGSGGSGGGAAALDLPEVSAANGRVYYLDGDQNIRSLAPNGGASDVIASVPGSSTAHVGFAVSPDGQSIAVSVLTYRGTAASVTSLYVEGLSGGSRHDITVPAGSGLVWPVAWHGSDLVLAVAASGFSQQGLAANPYAASSFELVDPSSSTRVASIGGPDPSTGCEVTGLVVPAGTACTHSASQTTSELWMLNWSGARTDTLAVQRPSPTAALNPDQQSVAICCDSSAAVLVARAHGTPAATALEGSPDSWPCWLDDQHVLAGSVNDHQFQPGVLAVGIGTVTHVTGAHGFCAAVLGSAGAAGEPM
jgi:hypothetical protein